MEKVEKWERSKDLSLRVYSVSKPKEPGKQRQQFKKWRAKWIFKMIKMIAIKLNKCTTGKTKQKLYSL